MRKKISIIVCDCCEAELFKDDEHYKCCICNKDVCSDCITTIFEKGDSPFEDMLICNDCEGDSKKFDREMRKFFNQKPIRTKLDDIQNELKKHLVKLTMLKNIS